jgi:hypothetical protein
VIFGPIRPASAPIKTLAPILQLDGNRTEKQHPGMKTTGYKICYADTITWNSVRRSQALNRSPHASARWPAAPDGCADTALRVGDPPPI